MKMTTNKPIPQKFEAAFEQVFAERRPLFCIVGDLTLKGVYGESVLAFTEDEVVAFDCCFEGGVLRIPFSQIKEAKLKRLYGNALFKVKTQNGKRLDLLRFTYAAADIADAAAVFINSVNDGGYSDELLETVKAVYRKLRSFCPKCGKKLPTPDAECINCSDKKKILSKLAKYVLPQKNGLILCMFLSAFTTAMSLVPPYITKQMVDEVLPNKDAKGLIMLVLLLLAVYVLQHVVGAIRAYKLRMAGDSIVVNLKKDIYAKAQYLPMSFYDKTSTGSVINRVNSDTVVLQNFVMKISQEAVVQGFLLVGLVIIMFCMSWRLTLFSFIPIPLVVITGKVFGKKIAPLYRRIWRRSSSISTLLADTIPGIRIIKAFTNEESAIAKFTRYCDEWLKEDRRVARIAGIFPALITFFVTCGSLIIWALGGKMAMDSEVSIGTLVSFVSYAGMFYAPVNFFANLSDTYQNTIASVEKILDILDAEPENNFGKDNCPKRIDGKIEFKNVNFSFDRSKKVLSDINLVIEPGDIVGIVGTTGSGKSTLINLLMRYYDEYDGEILIDGQNIRDIDINYYRNQIGFVQQEPLMFRDTIFNNIAYGNQDIHVEQVLYAAEVANAHGFISRMPDAYDTMLGERGVGLSGGEKQRVSIARAVIKNPSILIFDEATAAVDSETEHLIQGAIERLIRGRTTIMIAHRLSTLRKANKIVVIDKGEIIECGPPEELMKLKGKYYKLVNIQSMSEELKSRKEAENFE